MSSGARVGAFMLVLLVALGAAYGSGMNGPFIGDDYPNFLHNPYVAMPDWDTASLVAAATSNQSGPTGRPIPALSFALNYWFAGQTFDAFHFKVTNLVIHLLTALAVYVLALKLFEAANLASPRSCQVMAMVASLIWAVHPIQLTNVLYVVQRMNSMATLVVALGLIVFVVGRCRFRDGERGGLAWMTVGVVGGTSIGLLCKETAVLLPALAVVIEATLFRLRTAHAGGRKPLVAFYTVMAGVPYLAAVFLAFFHFDLWRPAYAERDFSLVERLMSQTRVLWWYLGQSFFPNPGVLSFVQDDFGVSRGWLNPATTLYAALGLLGAVVASVLSWRATPWVAFTVGWFLVGHALEATVIPLELVYEHRNYTPSIGLFIGLTALGYLALSSVLRPTLLATVIIAIAVLLTAVTFVRSGDWRDVDTLAAVTIERKPNSPRAWMLQLFVLRARGADMREIYRAAVHTGDEGFNEVANPIMLMRIITLMQLGQTKVDKSVQFEPVLDVDGSLMLSLEPAALAEKRAQLSATVVSRLSSKPMYGLTSPTLRNLVTCIEQRTDFCVAMKDDFGQWMDAALTRPALEPSERQFFTWMKARLLQFEGRHDEALALMDEVVGFAPDSLKYQLRRVLAMLNAGRKAQTASMLEALEPLITSARDRYEVNAVRKVISDSPG